ncbi:MAG: hypothetical protein CVU05_10400 [Bacteroidetes bacterium HGW-Bacteroidetes-21]|jgi:hypothetical protein|nr:MAG: hypothetical protein CVU05_10400 [Bacteroidetes bacterium HGW-Bacteroidetes-21]
MKSFKKQLSEKVLKLAGEPKMVARSFALGSFMGVTPLIGMQIIISILLAWILKLSKAAAIVGVINTNWTKGLFLYPINYKIGACILGVSKNIKILELFKGNILENFQEAGIPVFLSLLVGGCITGLILATGYYFLILRILKSSKLNFHKNDKTMKTTENKYAMITGASQGLGKAIAMELASRKINLLLVSLKNEGLSELCEEIKSLHGVDVRYFETDFFERDSVYEVSKWASSIAPVYMLINNAGLGGTKAFGEASPEYVDTIIQVNVRTTSLLTRLLLPELKKHEKSYILNVASMASFSPFAFKTVYPASKAFVYSFSRGLHEELKGTGVFVSVIHPGPIKTNADVTARIEKQGFFGKMGLVSPERLAYIAIQQLLKRDSLILPGILNKINWLLMMLLPNAWKLPLLSRVVRREINPGIPVASALSSTL